MALYRSQGEVRKRCEHCKKEISGPRAKQAQDKLLKILSQCQSCGKAVCHRHSMRYCLDCREYTGLAEFAFWSLHFFFKHNIYKHTEAGF